MAERLAVGKRSEAGHCGQHRVLPCGGGTPLAQTRVLSAHSSGHFGDLSVCVCSCSDWVMSARPSPRA
jgi:hypothetical protein